jgi:hypothetical protein
LIRDELTASAAELTEPGLIKSAVHEFKPGHMTLMNRNSKSQALDGYELIYRREEPNARITALQFVFYRKGTVRPAGQPVKQGVGVWPLLQLREANGRPVQGCYAYVNRRPQGRDQFAYGVDKEPVRFEFDVSEWPDKLEEFRSFLRSCLEAFPGLIEANYRQFHQLEMRSRRPEKR